MSVDAIMFISRGKFKIHRECSRLHTSIYQHFLPLRWRNNVVFLHRLNGLRYKIRFPF